VSIRGESCSIAFKEWAGVCDALCEGRQVVILRKGGVSESAGAGEFVPEHSEFWLYPTWVHQAAQGLRSQGALRVPIHGDAPGPEVKIRALVRSEVLGFVERVEALPALEEYHILTRETVLNRFHYRRPGLWVLGARVWRHENGFAVTATPEYAGCKTWVTLEQALPTSHLLPVLDDDRWAEVCAHIRPMF
jgi:hypothetical protein